MIELDLQLRQGDFRLLAALSAPPGVTAIFGPSGAGKSSLARAVAGLARPDRGRIALGDRVLFDSARGVNLAVRRRRIGYVFQEGRLFPHLSVGRNLRYGGRRDEARIVELLGLGPLLRRRPGRLSGGERQRVALGRALMSDPELLILDEPLAALDAPRKAEILPYLERLRDEAGVPMLYISHDVSEVARLATTLALIDGGRITRAGPVDEVLADPAAVPLLGVQEAGALLHARVTEYDAADELTTLAVSAGRLTLPGRIGTPGDLRRIRVPAQDVILALDRPGEISALNVLPARVVEVVPGRGPGVAVALASGEDRLLARVTRRSARKLDLREGMDLHAIIKASAVSPSDVGG